MNALVVVVALVVALVVCGSAVWSTVVVNRRSNQAAVASVRTLVDDFGTTFRDSVLSEQRAVTNESLQQVLSVADQSLRTRSDALTSTAHADLDARETLLGQRLVAMDDRLAKLTELMVSIDRDRERSFGELHGRITEAARTTESLTSVTTNLHQALSSSQVRGQWGERLAEDVLRSAGFVEGVSYRKETTIDGVGTRPDFTFLLPHDRVVHMDAKFPLAAYLRYLDAESDGEAAKHRKQFLKDASDRVKELVDRDYVDPGRGTVDYMLLFIPNESVFQFICDGDSAFLDRAIAQKVVCCSPMTLFAVLAVIRQAVDNFTFAQRSEEILDLLAGFITEYDKFNDQVDKVGGHLERTTKAYESLVGTRRRAMQKTLDQINTVRQDRRPDVAPHDDAVREGRAAPMVSITGRDLDRQAREGVA